LNPTPILGRQQWHARLAQFDSAHLLQSWDWGEFKSRYGWSPRRLAWEAPGRLAGAASVLRRGRLAAVLYAPRGPALDWRDPDARREVLGGLEELARQESTIFIKIDPDVVVAVRDPGDEADCPDPLGAEVAADLRSRGWRPSAEQIQFPNTVRLDLSRPEDELLAAMKQKTRYNVRLAARKGVRVRAGSPADLGLLYRMYAETSVRDGFVIRPPQYYHDAWGSFLAAGLAQPFVAEVGDVPVAALIVFRFGGAATYMYGMSTESHREKMPNHLLQWEAIRWAKAQGCRVYDFWGAPARLDPQDPLWGVWKFKEGFGGRLVRTLGAWDYVVSPLAYRLYSGLLPRLLAVMRRLGRRRTQAELGGG
jgi:lipid II:glycine glycyltransferase (peptidoglycan interpeptide bridge formation enzyme)